MLYVGNHTAAHNMVRAYQVRLQCMTNAGWQGQEKGKEDTEGFGTAGSLFAAIVAPAA